MVIEVDSVDFSVESVIVGTERAEDVPHRSEPLIVVKGIGRICACGNCDGKNNVSVGLAFRFPHNASDRLNDVNV